MKINSTLPIAARVTLASVLMLSAIAFICGAPLTSSSDISQTQAQSGQPVGLNNFREDVTVNGLINSSDISFVQTRSGTGLP